MAKSFTKTPSHLFTIFFILVFPEMGSASADYCSMTLNDGSCPDNPNACYHRCIYMDYQYEYGGCEGFIFRDCICHGRCTLYDKIFRPHYREFNPTCLRDDKMLTTTGSDVPTVPCAMKVEGIHCVFCEEKCRRLHYSDRVGSCEGFISAKNCLCRGQC